MKILLVEDNLHRGEWMKVDLSQYGEVHWAKSKQEALTGLKWDGPFGFVFLDFDLGNHGGEGRVVAEELAIQRFPGTVVIHSANLSGALGMEGVLQSVGVRVHRASVVSPYAMRLWREVILRKG